MTKKKNKKEKKLENRTNQNKKMKKIKITMSILILLLVIFLSAITCYMLIDTESKIPEQLKEPCKIEEKEYKERNVFLITPKNEEKTNKFILYLHGGAYMAETSEKHWEFIEKLTNETKATIILPDYPLTPKYNYKDVFEMVEPLYKEIINKIGTENLILMGDSAGGGLALALEEKIGEQNLSMPSKTILISPWLDIKLENPEIEEYQKRDKQLNKETLKLAGIVYAADGIDSYLVSPINGDLSKLKNITILIGTNDILNPDVKLLQQKAQEQNIQIEVKEYKDAGHIWMIEKNSTQELINQGYQEIINEIGSIKESLEPN